jgi:hypothetical protein
VRIFFREGKAKQTFSDHAELEARFGADLAARIATRLALFEAVRNLEAVPRRPPIALRQVDGSIGEFTVDLANSRKLHFLGLDGDGDQPTDDPGAVVEIEVLGVD